MINNYSVFSDLLSKEAGALGVGCPPLLPLEAKRGWQLAREGWKIRSPSLQAAIQLLFSVLLKSWSNSGGRERVRADTKCRQWINDQKMFHIRINVIPQSFNDHNITEVNKSHNERHYMCLSFYIRYVRSIISNKVPFTVVYFSFKTLKR